MEIPGELKIPRIVSLFSQIVVALLIAAPVEFCWAQRSDTSLAANQESGLSMAALRTVSTPALAYYDQFGGVDKQGNIHEWYTDESGDLNEDVYDKDGKLIEWWWYSKKGKRYRLWAAPVKVNMTGGAGGSAKGETRCYVLNPKTNAYEQEPVCSPEQLRQVQENVHRDRSVPPKGSEKQRSPVQSAEATAPATIAGLLRIRSREEQLWLNREGSRDESAPLQDRTATVEGRSTAPQNQGTTSVRLGFVSPAYVVATAQAPGSREISGTIKGEPSKAPAPGQAYGTISGTVVSNPEQYKGSPGFQVTELGSVNVPVGPDGQPLLDKVVVDINGVSWFAADPITFRPAAQNTITLRSSNNRAEDVPRRLSFQTRPPAVGFNASPLCVPGFQAAHGPLSGNIRQMGVVQGNRVIFPFAANEATAFYLVGDDTPAGPAPVMLVDGLRAYNWQTSVLKLITGLDKSVLVKNEATNGHVSLEVGERPPGKLDAGPADPDLVNWAEIERLDPDFRPPQAGQSGGAVVVITNNSLDRISIKGFKGPARVYFVPEKSLTSWKETLGIRAKEKGGFNIGIRVTTLAKEVPGKQFLLPPELVAQSGGRRPVQNLEKGKKRCNNAACLSVTVNGKFVGCNACNPCTNAGCTCKLYGRDLAPQVIEDKLAAEEGSMVEADAGYFATPQTYYYYCACMP